MRQLPRDFVKAMGPAIKGDRMTIATKDEVTILANVPALTAEYSVKPNFHDSFFVPRATYYTGTVDISLAQVIESLGQ